MIAAVEILLDDLAGDLRLDFDLVLADNLTSVLVGDWRILLQDFHRLDLRRIRCRLLLLRSTASEEHRSRQRQGQHERQRFLVLRKKQRVNLLFGDI